MPRRKPESSAGLAEDLAEPTGTQARHRPDPQEVRIYVKQLKKALKFLPLGSRAYYYVSGELVRADAELRIIGGKESRPAEKDDSREPSSPS